VSFSDYVPSHHGATQKPEATQANSVPFFSLLCPTVLIFDFFFLGEKEVWRVSTSTGPRRTRRPSSGVDAATSSSYSVREHELPGKSGAIVSTSTNVSSWQGLHGDNSQVSQLEQYNRVPPFLNIRCLGKAS
jgi:hypothetical protein